MPTVLNRPKTVQSETVSKTVFAKAKSLIRSRDTVENKAILDLRELLTGLGLRYIKAVLKKRSSKAVEQFREALETLLLRSMLTASLTGFNQARLEFEPQELSLLRGELEFLKSISEASSTSLDEFSKAAKGWSAGISSRLVGTFNSDIEKLVQIGVKRGETVSNIASKIAASLSDVKSWKIHHAVRGQVNRAYAIGRESALSEVAEFIQVEEFVAVGDDRTRPDHWARHGTRLPRDDVWWSNNTPPLDDMCRCIKIAHFDTRVKATKRPETHQVMIGRDKDDRPILRTRGKGVIGQEVDLSKTYRSGDVGSILQVWPKLEKDRIVRPGKLPPQPKQPYDVNNPFVSADEAVLRELIQQAEAYLSALRRWGVKLKKQPIPSSRQKQQLASLDSKIRTSLNNKDSLERTWRDKKAALETRLTSKRVSTGSKEVKGEFPRKPSKPFSSDIKLTGLIRANLDTMAQKAEVFILALAAWIEELGKEILSGNRVSLAERLIGEGLIEIEEWENILDILTGTKRIPTKTNR